MKSLVKMAQEISVIMEREYPGLNFPIVTRTQKVLFKQDLNVLKEYIEENSSNIIQYPVLYKYLKKELSDENIKESFEF